MYPERPIETTKRKELPPLGLKIFKGEREMTMSRYEYEYLYFIVFFFIKNIICNLYFTLG